MNKPRSLRWAVHAANMEGMRNAYKLIAGNIKGNPHLTDLSM
jgi:hypothetical protein